MLTRSSTLLLLGLLAAHPLSAQQAPATGAEDPAQRAHVVRRGDTLWDIARQYLNNPFLWPEIYQANRSLVRDPDLIFPAQRLLIPPVSTAVAVEPAAEEPEPAVREVAEAPPVEAVEAEPPARSLFYAAARGPAVETVPAGGVMETVGGGSPYPEVQPGEYYSAPWLSDPERLPVVGRFVDKPDRGVLKQKDAQAARPFDTIYLGYAAGAPVPQVGDRLLLVRIDRNVAGLGRVTQPTAVVTVVGLSEEVMTAFVSQQFEETRRGDLALPLEAFPAAEGVRAQRVEGGPAGRVIEFLQEQSLYGPTDHAFVDLGRAQGLNVGDELAAVVPPRRADSPRGERLPAQTVAHMSVVRVTDRTATVRVTAVDNPLLEPGIPVQVVRRMP